MVKAYILTFVIRVSGLECFDLHARIFSSTTTLSITTHCTMTFSKTTFSIIALSIKTFSITINKIRQCKMGEGRYAEYCLCCVAIKLFMLNIVMPSAIMLSVVAPF